MDHLHAYPLLTDAEDRLLALAEDEFVTARFARNILGVFYGRPVGAAEMRAITGRLSALRLIRWRVRGKGMFRATGRLDASRRDSPGVRFTATDVGKAWLAQGSRRVMDSPDNVTAAKKPLRINRFERLVNPGSPRVSGGPRKLL